MKDSAAFRGVAKSRTQLSNWTRQDTSVTTESLNNHKNFASLKKGLFFLRNIPLLPLHLSPMLGNGSLHFSHCSKKKKMPKGMNGWLSELGSLNFFFFCYCGSGIASVVYDLQWETVKSEKGFTESRKDNRPDSRGSSGMPWEAARPRLSTQRPGGRRVIRPIHAPPHCGGSRTGLSGQLNK